jgi:hypothetical protein
VHFACMGGVLRAERVWVETFTGLRMRQFERLLKAVRERGGDGARIGRPWCLPLGDRVLLVAVYYRTNLTMRQLAPLFGVSSATVCRVIKRLGPLLSLEPASRPADAADRLWIVDGTLIPVRDRRVSASSRNYRFSANVQASSSTPIPGWWWPPPGRCPARPLMRGPGVPPVWESTAGVSRCWVMVPTSTPDSSSHTESAQGAPCYLVRKRTTQNTARSAPASSTPSPA